MNWRSMIGLTTIVAVACVSSPSGCAEPTALENSEPLEFAPPIGVSKTGIDYGSWRSNGVDAAAPDTPETAFKNSVATIFKESGYAKLVTGLRSDNFQCQFKRVSPMEPAPGVCKASAFHFSPGDSRTAWSWTVEFSGEDVVATHEKETEFIHLTIEPE